MANSGIINALLQTWPARMAQDAWSAAKLPGDVVQGKAQVPSAMGVPGSVPYESPQGQETLKRTTDLAGALMGGSYAAAPAVQGGAGMGIRAYHGSPHDFDRFDLSKIGTGEGAQAYGHGLYFAEKESVAKSYRDSLAKVVGDPQLSPAARDLIIDQGGLDQAIAKAKTLTGRLSSLGPELENYQAYMIGKAPGGRMYEVNINAKPEQFLDWDKKVRDMPNELQANLSKLGWNVQGPDQGLVGSQIINRGIDAGGATAASRTMNEAGIPGIKYLDQGSRSAGEGSRNYVVFDDRLIDILRKYGILAPTAGGMAAALSQGQEQ